MYLFNTHEKVVEKRGPYLKIYIILLCYSYIKLKLIKCFSLSENILFFHIHCIKGYQSQSFSIDVCFGRKLVAKFKISTVTV